MPALNKGLMRGLATGLLLMACATQAAELLVVGDAIPDPLTTTAGNAARGREIVASRQSGLCLLCHSGPFTEDKF